MVLFAGLLDLTEPAEVIGRLFGKRVQAGGKHRAIEAMLAGGFEQAGNLGRVRVLAQVPAEYPDKAVRIRSSRLPPNHQREKQQQRERGRALVGRRRSRPYAEPGNIRQFSRAKWLFLTISRHTKIIF